jgi:polyisoprenoid-binding protein YceI
MQIQQNRVIYVLKLTIYTSILKYLKMNKLFFLAIITFLMVSCNSGSNNAEQAATNDALTINESNGTQYNLITSESFLQWRGTKPAGEHSGSVDIKEGTINLDNGIISGGSFTIDLKTIENEDVENSEMNTKLVNHLKSEDFFHVDEYPNAKFELVSVNQDSGNSEITNAYNITGNLTIKGITKSIIIPAQVDMKDGYVIASTEEFSIDRTLWNVNYQSQKIFAGLKDKYINDEINLKLELKFEEI